MYRLGGVQHGPPQMFASVFTFACFLIFLFPWCTAWHVGLDANVGYWVGLTAFFWLLLPIPVLFGVNYFMQTKHHRPKRSMVLACLICPSVLFFLVGGTLQFQAGHIGAKLTSRDCRSWPRMRKLDLSWQAAKTFLDACREANPALGHRLMIQTCPGYMDYMWEGKHNYEWEYLQFLEMNYGCVGFCGGESEAAPIWSLRQEGYEAPPDPCGAAVASVLRTKVGQAAQQLMMFSMIALFVCLSWMAVFGAQVLSGFAKPSGGAGARPEKFTPAPMAPGSVPGTAGSFYTPQAQA